MFLNQSDLSKGTLANYLEGFEVIFSNTRAPQSEELCLLVSVLHSSLLSLGRGGKGSGARGRGGNKRSKEEIRVETL